MTLLNDTEYTARVSHSDDVLHYLASLEVATLDKLHASARAKVQVLTESGSHINDVILAVIDDELDAMAVENITLDIISQLIKHYGISQWNYASQYLWANQCNGKRA